MRGFLDVLREKVVVFDGATGTNLSALGVTPDDFGGHAGLADYLCLSRPDAVRALHDAFLAAGCDAVETNSFSCNALTLAEYGLAARAREIARAAARLAREAASARSTPDRPRFVAGSIGPGSRLPSLGHVAFRDLRAAFVPQAEGLIEGGADLLMIETCQDPLGAKAAVQAAHEAMRSTGRRVPICVSIAVEAGGSMLVGTDPAAAAAILAPLGVDLLGINCGFGPDVLARHVALLCEASALPVVVMPNAGAPEVVDGRTVYRLEPDRFARAVADMVREHGVAAAGGCCGTRPDHIRALSRLLDGVPAPGRPRPPPRAVVACLYSAVPIDQHPPPLLIGERCNSNGSRAFREALDRDDLDAMLEIARGQAAAGAHVLDLCVARPGRDEAADMARLVPRIATQIALPLMIDSTDPDAIEAALERHGGRCIVNSVNLESGAERFDRIACLAARFGAALVALAIDERGMARTRDRKIEVADRLVDAAVGRAGLRPSDLLIDPLTFTVAAGDDESRRAAIETLDAIAPIRERFPGVTVILGVGNVSYGLRPEARRVLTSAFLHEAVARGLGAAIVDARSIAPLDRIELRLLDAARRLIADDRSSGDPLDAFIAAFEGTPVGADPRVCPDEAATPAERLGRRVIDGRREGIEAEVDAAVAAGASPVELLDRVLLPAMREVGEAFGCGRTHLPFVLRSAEAMKAAIARIETLSPGGGASHGVVVLATVRGDVHDIGKNLVGTVLSTNGYRVVDLGVRVGVDKIVEAVERERADAVGLSGLLVGSTLVMRDDLREMARRGIRVPVLVGGAALTRAFAERDLRHAYRPGQVRYGADAFEGLREMDALMRNREGGGAVPDVPFTGSPGPVALPAAEVLELLDERTLLGARWGYRRGEASVEEHRRMLEEDALPALGDLKRRALAGELLDLRAVHGWFRCHSEDRQVVIFAPTGEEAARFEWCAAGAGAARVGDIVLPWFEGGVGGDVVGLFVVTAGERPLAIARARHEAGALLDSMRIHGFAVEAAEAAAEWVHRRMLAEIGVPPAGIGP
ncbi:MAG: homocysteine S-methyltransferase family protein, partial [Myxococcota bacterium]|nr:homocysteine S-methyltransferase family protein [Myxococcota bacterium]